MVPVYVFVCNNLDGFRPFDWQRFNSCCQKKKKKTASNLNHCCDLLIAAFSSSATEQVSTSMTTPITSPAIRPARTHSGNLFFFFEEEEEEEEGGGTTASRTARILRPEQNAEQQRRLPRPDIYNVMHTSSNRPANPHNHPWYWAGLYTAVNLS